jgi:fructose-specific phosphotransferase system component IIB
MSITLPNLGGTLTGGASATLSLQNTVAGKATFNTSAHTRLTPQTVEFLTTGAKTSSTEPGVARAQLRITYADRQVPTEGCCTVQAGLVAIDVNVRWHLNQPESLVDEVIEAVQSLVFTTEFADMIVKGTLPG